MQVEDTEDSHDEASTPEIIDVPAVPPIIVRPELLNFPGGHASFDKYKAAFDTLHGGEAIYDVRGRQVIFGHPRLNGEHDCAHAIYGTPSRKWYEEEHWNEARAARLPWIKAALTSPRVRVYLSQDGVYPKADSHVYMWIADSGDPEIPDEYYIVVTIDGKIFKAENTVCFYTAYHLPDVQTYRERQERYKCLWPEPKPSKKKGRSKGK